MRLLAAAVAVALLVALAVTAPVGAATSPSGLGAGGAAPPPSALGEKAVVRTFLAQRQVARWLSRYDGRTPATDATFDGTTRRWRVHVWTGGVGEVATGLVDDASGVVEETWTGPQVAWKMARGRPGAFGGKVLTSWPVWLALSALFFVGLADLRRPRALRNLDLLALLSFGVSLWFFNRGEIFRSVPLATVPLVYLLARTGWIGFRGRALAAARPVLPVWALVTLCLFLLGFRVGLNVETPRSVIDVGYAGVIGGQRLLDGQAPYGRMPVADASRPACGRPNPDGEIRERVQANGRCESANPRGDTYGPVAYLAYVPAVAAFGWGGRWDALPAAHAAAIAFDLLTVVGLALVGLRFGGRRLAATLAFAWAAYPFTAYALLANTNDALMPAALVWGFWLVSSPSGRGAAVATAGWAKFAALVATPLWLTYPGGLRRRPALGFAAAFAAVTAAAFSVLLLEPDVAAAARTFWDRTLGFQIGRDSPFSLWGWGQYRADGIPDLGWVQTLLQLGVLNLAVLAAALPRRKGPLELAALTAALLLGVQLVLTHWFYLYLPWMLPFVALALTLPRSDARADG